MDHPAIPAYQSPGTRPIAPGLSHGQSPAGVCRDVGSCSLDTASFLGSAQSSEFCPSLAFSLTSPHGLQPSKEGATLSHNKLGSYPEFCCMSREVLGSVMLAGSATPDTHHVTYRTNSLVGER